MTLPRYEVICAHWERVPPVSVSAAALARRYEALAAAPRKKAAPKSDDRASQRQSFLEMLGQMGFSSEKPEWLRAATTK